MLPINTVTGGDGSARDRGHLKLSFSRSFGKYGLSIYTMPGTAISTLVHYIFTTTPVRQEHNVYFIDSETVFQRS